MNWAGGSSVEIHVRETYDGGELFNLVNQSSSSGWTDPIKVCSPFTKITGIEIVKSVTLHPTQVHVAIKFSRAHLCSIAGKLGGLLWPTGCLAFL